MRLYNLFLILITLPFLAGLGHDIYLNYQEQGMNYEEYKLSAMGFLWIQYEPESFETVRSTLSDEDWTILSSWVLNQKTIIATAIFAGFFYALSIIMWLFKIGPYSHASSSRFSRARNTKTDEILGRAEQKKYKYRRG